MAKQLLKMRQRVSQTLIDALGFARGTYESLFLVAEERSLQLVSPCTSASHPMIVARARCRPAFRSDQRIAEACSCGSGAGFAPWFAERLSSDESAGITRVASDQGSVGGHAAILRRPVACSSSRPPRLYLLSRDSTHYTIPNPRNTHSL